MGILRNREELLPVTCAVLSAEDRNSFFSQLKKKCGGRVEKIATTGGTTKGTVSDWMSGKANVPYQALQQLASEFKVDMPPVSELRREYQAVVEVRAPKPSIPAPQKREQAPEKREQAPQKRESTQRKPPQKQERRPKKAEKAAAKPKEKTPAKPRHAAGPRIPKLSDKVAYWTGATLAVSHREGDSIIFKIDKRIGQNFTRVWSTLSEELFGVKAELKELEQATLPTKGLEDFIDRLELKEGKPAPGAPRWAWSNPDWKLAFLRGVIDASTTFKRDPALEIVGLSERLVQSVTKLLTAQKLELKPDEQEGEVGEPSILLEGRDQVKRYYLEIGTGNFKLNDQLKAFFKEARGAETASEKKPSSTTKKKARRRGGKGRGRGRGQGRRNPRVEAPGESAAAEFAGNENPVPEKKSEPKPNSSDD